MPARRPRRILRLRASTVGIGPEIWRTIDVDDSLLEALGLWRSASRRRDVSPAAAVRAIDRLALR